jgi:hypothetical protein
MASPDCRHSRNDIADMRCMLTRSGATISDFERGFPSEIYETTNHGTGIGIDSRLTLTAEPTIQRPDDKVRDVDRIWNPKRRMCLELPRYHKIDRDVWPIAAGKRGRPFDHRLFR